MLPTETLVQRSSFPWVSTRIDMVYPENVSVGLIIEIFVYCKLIPLGLPPSSLITPFYYMYVYR